MPDGPERPNERGSVAGDVKTRFAHTDIRGPADPRVRGGIADLAGRKFPVAPVGTLLAFRDAQTEKGGGKAAQPPVFNVVAPGDFTEIHDGARDKGAEFGQKPHVVVHGHACFDYGRVFEETEQALVQGLPFEMNEHDFIRAGKLDQSGGVRFPLAETGGSFRIKAKDAFPAQSFDGGDQILRGADESDPPSVMKKRQGVYVVPAEFSMGFSLFFLQFLDSFGKLP